MNEQPLMADLYAMPEASDAGLVCTNLRSIDGKRPTFIDRSESTFFFPYLVIRFIEVPEGSLARHAGGGRAGGAATPGPVADDPPNRLPVLVDTSDEDDGNGAGEADLEIDEDFMRRIRDI